MVSNEVTVLDMLYTDYVKSNFSVDLARKYLAEAAKIGDITFKKPLDSFNKRDERDLFVHVALHRTGMKFTVRAENAPDGFSNIDLKLYDRLWEVKSPTAMPRRDGRLKFIESNILKSKDQFKRHYPNPIKNCRIIFSNRFTAFEDKIVFPELKKELAKRNIKECLYIDKNGNVVKTI